MSFDEGVAERIREVFAGRHDIVEKKMFGGLAFMHHGHMCVGIVNDTLMARVGPDQYAKALKLPYARQMDFTGKPLKGFIYVAAKGFETDKDLMTWIERCEAFTSSLPPK